MVQFTVFLLLFHLFCRTRASKKEEASLQSYLDTSSTEKWIESAYDSEGPLYWMTMSVLVHSVDKWSSNRVSHIRRLIVLAHARHCSTTPQKTLSDKTVKDYAVYKPYLVFFGLIDGMYNNFFKVRIFFEFFFVNLIYLLYVECNWIRRTVVKQLGRLHQAQ